MFTRSPAADTKVIEPRIARPVRANGAQSPVSVASTGEKSVIGNDLKIIGQGLKIIGRGTLQVDGEIEGDVHHMSFAIEQGAVFEGRSRRAADESALNSVMEGKGAERTYAN